MKTMKTLLSLFLFSLVLSASPLHQAVIDINEDKFEMAGMLGATDFVNPSNYDQPIQEVIVELTNGGVDYTTLGGTVTILAGNLTADIDVIVVDDNQIESRETVILQLESRISGDVDVSIDRSSSATSSSSIGVGSSRRGKR